MRKALYILSELTDDDIIWMARAGSIRRVAPGETLIAAGREPDSLFFVLDGALEVVSPTGARLAELGLGDVVGEMSFVEKRPPSASVRALGAAELLEVPRAAMLSAFAANAGLAGRFWRALAMFLSDRLRQMSGPGDAELDEALLDTLQQAGERFIRLTGFARAVFA